jgi:hypothetical protein
MFFVLFFEPYLKINSDVNSKNKVSTTKGFIEDTRDAFIMPMYPTQLLVRDETGKIQPTYGDIGTFVPYSSVPEDHWLHGFPHEKA